MILWIFEVFFTFYGTISTVGLFIKKDNLWILLFYYDHTSLKKSNVHINIAAYRTKTKIRIFTKLTIPFLLFFSFPNILQANIEHKVTQVNCNQRCNISHILPIPIPIDTQLITASIQVPTKIDRRISKKYIVYFLLDIHNR